MGAIRRTGRLKKMEHASAEKVREALLLDEELRADVELYVDPEYVEAFLMGETDNEDFWKPEPRKGK